MKKPALYLLLSLSILSAMSCNKSSNDTLQGTGTKDSPFYWKYWPNITSSRKWAVNYVFEYPGGYSESRDTIIFNLRKLNDSMLVGTEYDTLKYLSSGSDSLTKVINFVRSVNSKVSLVAYYCDEDSIDYNTNDYIGLGGGHFNSYRTIK